MAPVAIKLYTLWSEKHMITTSEGPFNTKGEQLLSTIRTLVNQLEAQKSLERTERDRLLAIAVTDAQKLEAFIGHWLTH